MQTQVALTKDPTCNFYLTEDKKIQKFLEDSRKNNQHRGADFRGNKSFEIVAGKKYLIGPFLGSGGEGAVFLAQNPEGKLVTLKYFKLHKLARLHKENLNLLSKMGIRTLKIYATDYEHPKAIFVQEYIEGVSLLSLEQSNPYPLSQEQKSQIEKKVAALHKKLEGLDKDAGITIFKANVFYEFSTGELVVIDAR